MALTFLYFELPLVVEQPLTVLYRIFCTGPLCSRSITDQYCDQIMFYLLGEFAIIHTRTLGDAVIISNAFDH